MTEAQWAACTVPHDMIALTWKRHRKIRLFACACVRRLWRRWEPTSASVRAVEAAERFADGEAKRPEMRAAGDAVEPRWPTGPQWQRDADKAQQAAWWMTWLPGQVPSDMYTYWTDPVTELAEDAGFTPAAQCDLLREIFGPTWRKLPAADPAWLKWNDGAVRKLARAICDGRDFDCVPLVADALEEAGCMDAAMLAHCRGPGEHVRGCWVVDLLLGRA